MTRRILRIFVFGLFIIGVNDAACASLGGGTYTIGSSGYNYTTITAAVSAMGSGIGGPVIFELQTNYSPASETYPITIGAITGASAVNTITIRPASGVSSSIILTSGTNPAQILYLNGANYVTFDGRPGGSGSTPYLTFSNTFASGSAVTFINDASNNVIKYVTVQGVNTSSSSGVVVFGATTGTTGNDNNTITHCDIKDGTSQPAVGIYSAGTAAMDNSGNTVSNCTISNFRGGSTTQAGIYLASNNSDWTISGNSFFMSTAYAGTAATTMSGIFIAGAGNNYLIDGNFIGGNSASAAGTWTVNGTAATYKFIGINVNAGTSAASSIQNNTIRNFTWISTSNTGTAPGLWCGIYCQSGLVNIGTVTGNTIGSGTGTGSIGVSLSTNSGGISYGIVNGSSSANSISQNIIGSVSVIGATASQSHGFIGIATTSGNTAIAGNVIGSTGTANSIIASTASISTIGQPVIGVWSSSTGTVSVTDNTIANITNNSVGTTAGTYLHQTRGILIGSALSSNPAAINTSATVTGNTVYSLSTSVPTPAASVNSSLIGISVLMNNTVTPTTISRNTIHTLANTTGTAAVEVDGIYTTTGTLVSGTHTIARNLIHSLTTTSSGISSALNGIKVASGTNTLQNNMIRLGINAAGGSITTGMQIFGINEAGGSNNLYFNSIYIGGSGVIAVNPTYAFSSVVTTNVRTYMNNIFCNARSNASGSGINYAIKISAIGNNLTSLTSNYNDFYAPGVGGMLGISKSSLGEWLATTGQDANSLYADPFFILPTGTSATLDMHLTASGTPAEGSGLAIAAVSDDFDGTARSTVTPTDIGADAGTFTFIDNAPPIVLYTPIANRNLAYTAVTSLAEVTDNVAVAGGASLPRLYYKKSTDANAFVGNASSNNGWKYVVANNSTSPYSFALDYSILNGGSPSVGETIAYFVVAQDNANNFSSYPYGAAASANPPVQNINAFAGTASTFVIWNTISGAVTIGTGGTYPTLTGTGGLFADMNGKVVIGNITATIVGNIAETSVNPLNEWAESPVGANYTLTIQSDGTLRTLTGTDIATNPMIRINGADRVTISGGTGTQRLLTLRNTNSTPSNNTATIEFTNGSISGKINNCIVEGNYPYTISKGAVSCGTGTNVVTIDRNDIRDATGGTIGYLALGVTSSSATNTLTISNNNIFNGTSFPDAAATNIYGLNLMGEGCSVTGNSIYCAGPMLMDYAFYGIYFNGGNNNTISGNYIGGSSPNCGGSPFTMSGNATFVGISFGGSTGTTTASSVQNNTIQNIALTGTVSNSFQGITVGAGKVNIGTSAGNTIGHASTANNVQTSGGGNITGISVGSAQTVQISNNLIANLTLNHSGSSNMMRGIYCSGGWTSIISNTIRDLTSNSSNILTGSQSAIVGIAEFNVGANIQTVSQNKIHSLISTDAAAAVGIIGIYFFGNPSSAHLIERNYIHSFSNAGTNAAAVQMGISIELGNGTYQNNIIRLGIKPDGTSQTAENTFYGIYEIGGTNNVYFNTVYVGGSGVGPTATPTYALNSTVTSGTRAIRNNIFVNARSNASTGGKHYAIMVGGTAPNPSGLTINNNIYAASGTGGTLGSFNSADAASLSAWRTAVGQDAGSFNFSPTFANATGSKNTADLHLNLLSADLNYLGSSIPGITNDYDGQTRNASAPFIGADENLTVPLPVELLSFTAFTHQHTNTLKWTTATEVNSQGFDVERNLNGSWAKIGFVAGHGTTNSANEYIFTDNLRSSTKIMYRLKQIDRDGAYTYSSAVDVTAGLMEEDYTLSANYPNPFNPSTHITFAVKSAELTDITVYNLLGQEVATLYHDIAQPNQLYTVSFNGANAASGTYFYHLKTATRSEVRRMQLLK